MTVSRESAAGRVTLVDVAREAHVSPATVSRALRDDPRISAPTRKTVQDAAERLAYIPNAAARSLRARRTRTLGLVIADLSDPVHGMVASGFEIEAGEAGYTVIFVSGQNDPVRERRALTIFTEQGTDGIALVSSVLDPSEARSRTRPDRLILVQPDHRTLMPGRTAKPGVVQADDRQGIAAIIDHLVDRGYRDIAYVGGGVKPSNTIRRETAVRRLRQRGIRAPMRRFQAGANGFRSPGPISAAIARNPPEAIVCYDDKLALAVLDGLRGRGVSVPEQIAVTGFDDVPFAAISNPRLTTVAAPTHELGRTAARALIAAIHSGELPPAVLLPVHLAVRESTPPLARRLRPGWQRRTAVRMLPTNPPDAARASRAERCG
jgi:LacI family transcriptional regulator, galactose operon repressor